MDRPKTSKNKKRRAERTRIPEHAMREPDVFTISQNYIQYGSIILEQSTARYARALS